MASFTHSCSNVELGALEQLASFSLVGTCKADNDRHVGVDEFESFDKSLSNVVATCDTTKDIDENDLYVFV